VMEFLVHMRVTAIPGGTDAESALLQRESKRARELADAGILLRLWRIPGRRENWGIWEASDVNQLHDALASLPMFPYLVITVHPLAAHPNDPRSPAFSSNLGMDQQKSDVQEDR
jgi:muconolactone D-isomerase